MNRITCPKTSLSYSANTFVTSEERNLSIMNRITCPKTSLSYSANTFITSEERKPLYNEQNNLSQKLRYSEVPLLQYFIAHNIHMYIIMLSLCSVCEAGGGFPH